MFKRTGVQSRFDSVSLVEVQMKQTPEGEIGMMQMKLCYLDAATGTTFGYVDMVHNPSVGLEVLSPEVTEAWAKFVAAVEKQQGMLLFGSGQLSKALMGIGEGGPENEDEGLEVGLGGGR